MAEIWDLYDENKALIRGAFHERDSEKSIPLGMYHMAVWLYMVTRSGKMFLTQRALTKSRSLQWEPSGGSVQSGEKPIQACVREVKEETSIDVPVDRIRFFKEERGKDWILEYYYVVVDDIDIESLTLQEAEVSDAKLVTFEELSQMNENNELVAGVFEGFDDVLWRVKLFL